MRIVQIVKNALSESSKDDTYPTIPSVISSSLSSEGFFIRTKDEAFGELFAVYHIVAVARVTRLNARPQLVKLHHIQPQTGILRAQACAQLTYGVRHRPIELNIVMDGGVVFKR